MSTPLIEGRIYCYTATDPKACHGHRYLLDSLAMFVPVGQEVCVVKALSGPDKGHTFVCSLSNFSQRYELASEVYAQATNEMAAKVAGRPEGPGY